MIVGADAATYDVLNLLDVIGQAARGVVRVSTLAFSGAEGICTGWLVDESLVIIPGHAVARPGSERFSCLFAGESDGADIPAELVYRDESADVALLRLRWPRPGHSLTVGTGETALGQHIMVLHHPRGLRRLQLSLGQLLNIESGELHHDADTEPGSAGGPMIEPGTGVVLGMHWGFGRAARTGYNRALPIAAVMDALRRSRAWTVIADGHHLADVGAAKQWLDEFDPAFSEPAERDLIPAALLWRFDPAQFSAAIQDRLRPMIPDPAAKRWSLVADDRKRLIGLADSLDELRTARYRYEAARGEGQRVIDRILEGTPVDLDKLTDKALPYWLQAVRWFDGVVPDLPAPAEIHQVMEQRRVVSRLHDIAGPEFRGRDTELDLLRAWHADPAGGPIVISGIGGIGKSALAAAFATELVPDNLLLWLDFDRADLAPDDAFSVLSLVIGQARTQLDGMSTRFGGESWETAADQVGTSLAAALPADRGVLVVLDGFEVAQHRVRHQEIWAVLERLLDAVPAMRIIVSGRAPVADLSVAGRRSRSISLRGLSTDVAERWLRDRGFADRDVVDEVVRVSRGVPLILKLAVRLLDVGGDIREVPTKLPSAMIEGFLYRRVLDRVITPSFGPLVRDALVLRRVTVELMGPVLGDAIPTDLAPEQAFTQLSRELDLVESPETGAAMRMRPEVRTATLRLLETDDAERVHTVDSRAADFYAGHTDDAGRAEHVYHLLRLGDVAQAEKVWVDACTPLLRDAITEIPETRPAAREWLRQRVTGAETSVSDLEDWEADATLRISAAMRRGLERAVPEILRERPDRTPDGTLVLYDAWTTWREGNVDDARRQLADAGLPDGPTGRSRAVLGAQLARVAGDREQADRLLCLALRDDTLADESPEALAMVAARIRLAVDLRAELEFGTLLADYGDHLHDPLTAVLSEGDFVLPSLSDAFSAPFSLETIDHPVKLPATRGEMSAFVNELNSRRRLRLEVDEPLPWRPADLGLDIKWPSQVSTKLERGLRLGLDLAALAQRRWQLAVTTPYLCRVSALFGRTATSLEVATASTLVAFQGCALSVETEGGVVATDHLLAFTGDFLTSHRTNEFAVGVLAHEHREATSMGARRSPFRLTAMLAGLESYLHGPDPLDMLGRDVLHRPATLDAP